MSVNMHQTTQRNTLVIIAVMTTWAVPRQYLIRNIDVYLLVHTALQSIGVSRKTAPWNWFGCQSVPSWHFYLCFSAIIILTTNEANKQIIVLCVLCTKWIPITHYGLVVSVKSIQLENHLADLNEILCGNYTILYDLKIILLNILRAVITKWRMT